MKNVFCAVALIVLGGVVAVQAQEGPKVFIDSQAYARTQTGLFGGIETDSSIISAPEIASRFSQICPNCQVTIKKDSADYVATFAASQTAYSKPWSWAVYENEGGALLQKGETRLFNNAIKDAAVLIITHWGKNVQSAAAASEDASLSTKYPVQVFFQPKQKIRKGNHKANTGKVIVDRTEKKAMVTIVSLNPEIATFPDDSDRITIETTGSPVNIATFNVRGTGKRGMAYFKAFVVELK